MSAASEFHARERSDEIIAQLKEFIVKDPAFAARAIQMAYELGITSGRYEAAETAAQSFQNLCDELKLKGVS